MQPIKTVERFERKWIIFSSNDTVFSSQNCCFLFGTYIHFKTTENILQVSKLTARRGWEIVSITFFSKKNKEQRNLQLVIGGYDKFVQLLFCL